MKKEAKKVGSHYNEQITVSVRDQRDLLVYYSKLEIISSQFDRGSIFFLFFEKENFFLVLSVTW
jgi:hypothetical protein